MRQIVLIAHNLRSCHNVGSILRTAEGLGVEAVWLTGYTPYPSLEGDRRMPHESRKLSKQINKTALGAEDYQTWFQNQDVITVIKQLKSYGYTICALEQTKNSKELQTYDVPERLALIVGREIEGLEHEIIDYCDEALEIPMAGKKESYNVSVAAAMALFYLKFAKQT